MLEEEEEAAILWRAVFERIIVAPVAKVWNITSDFVGMHKWASSILQSCPLLEGDPRTPGCLRKAIRQPRHGITSSSEERLLDMDPDKLLYKYQVETCTVARFKGYVATFQVVDEGNDTTRVLWSYEVPPVPELTEEAFMALTFPVYEICMRDLEEYLAKQD